MINNKINNIYNQNNELPMNSLQEKTIDTIPKHPLLETNKAMTEDSYKVIKKMQEEIRKCEYIAIKMIKGENVTPKEFKFISYKYPDIKNTAEKSIQESNQLKEVLKNCKTDEEVEQVLSKALKDISSMVKKGELSEIQGKIKIISLEECKKQFKNINNENRKIEQIVLKIIRNKKLTPLEKEIINKDYPHIKKIIKESVDENNLLKEKLNLCKNENEKKEVIAKVINIIKENSQKGILSKFEKIIKLELIIDTKDNLRKENIQLEKVVTIAKKIIKGVRLSSNENRIIDEKYSNIKQFTKEILNEYEVLKKEINLCSTNEKKQLLLNDKIEKIKNIESEEVIYQVQEDIKKEIIAKIKEFERNKYKENELNFYLNPYLYLLSCGLSSKVSIIILSIIIVSILIFFIN